MDDIVVAVPCENVCLLQSSRSSRSQWTAALLGLGFLTLTAMCLSSSHGTAGYVRTGVASRVQLGAPVAPKPLIEEMVQQPTTLPMRGTVHYASQPSQLHLEAGQTQGPGTFAALAVTFLAGFVAARLFPKSSTVAMYAATAEGSEKDKDGLLDLDEMDSPIKDKSGLLDLEDMELPMEDEGKGAKAGAESVETEMVTGQAENFGFETNTRQILDIVARSLYHDKEVFIRELVSNASDAIEKYRYLKLISDQELEDAPEPRISLYCDPVKNTFTVQDTGVGMTKEELVNNLGTIASSGSKQLMERLQAAQQQAMDDQLIGQFGVGFYSAFIVANTVKVYTRSCQKGAKGYLWESDGHGNYTIAEAEGVAQGTKIIVNLKEEDKEFSNDQTLEKIIQKYSNFIGSPIILNGKRINTVEALWRKNPKDVSDEQYAAFYKYISGAYDKPTYRLHYRVDAPVDIKAVLFVPQYNMEQPGRSRLTSSVSLYCKKVLIKAKCPDLLPEWMRFVSGVVDSEDLPLNVSREGSQDSRAFRKLSKLVTGRVLKWLADEADKDKTGYNAFFKEFGYFLKEGSCTDQKNQAAVAKLLRFESSKLEAGDLTSFDEYIERFAEGQERIYFLHTPSRQTALMSPYYEQLRKKGVEVLFMYGQLDEYLMANYPEYKGHKFASIENSDLGLDAIKTKETAEETKTESEVDGLTEKQGKRFSKFLVKALADKCSDAKPSTRLVDSPAIIAAGFEQAAMFRHLKQIANMQGKKGFEGPLGMQAIEFNPKHPIIKRLYWLTRDTDPSAQERAKLMAEQIFDNALIASGLLDDPRLMLNRLNTLLKDSLNDVTIGHDDETDTPADLEEPPAKKPVKDAPVSPAEAARIRELMAKEFGTMDEGDQEKMNKMMADAMAEGTMPMEPNMDFDIQDAEFTEKTEKGPKSEPK